METEYTIDRLGLLKFFTEEWQDFQALRRAYCEATRTKGLNSSTFRLTADRLAGSGLITKRYERFDKPVYKLTEAGAEAKRRHWPEQASV